MKRIKLKYKDMERATPNIISERGRHRTDIEIMMTTALKQNSIDVVEEYPVRSKYGYILDFAIPELKIDIETDGEHYHKKGNAHDRKRNWALRNKGWKIIRFRGKDIKDNIDECIKTIKLIITERRLILYEN